jgi:hypothetical protein
MSKKPPSLSVGKGAPTAAAFRASAKTAKPQNKK